MSIKTIKTCDAAGCGEQETDFPHDLRPKFNTVQVTPAERTQPLSFHFCNRCSAKMVRAAAEGKL